LSASDVVKDNTWPAPSSVDTDNLPNELTTHGYSFADYADQGLPTQWLRYTTTPGTADAPNPMDKRLADFPSTPEGFASLPTVSLVVGNGDQSMHDGSGGPRGVGLWTAPVHPQICALPPSTKSSMPVTKLESSEARNSAALATSSGSPMRPIGMVEAIFSMVS
jgi:hypothetical protein